jgi:hypothetical protein
MIDILMLWFSIPYGIYRWAVLLLVPQAMHAKTTNVVLGSNS